MMFPTKESFKLGTEFINENKDLSIPEIENNILVEFLLGNIPDFIKDFKEIEIDLNNNSIKYYVSPDYLSIGSNEDYVRIPMNPLTAQAIASQYHCVLPTTKMVKDIWFKSNNKLDPLPWGPPYDSSMRSLYRVLVHNERINSQLNLQNHFDLTSGHKKDVVLTNQLYPDNKNKKVAIYGWIQSNGNPIQGLNPSDHDQYYADYSHGIRLIDRKCKVNNVDVDILNVFKDAELSKLISNEGILNFTSY